MKAAILQPRVKALELAVMSLIGDGPCDPVAVIAAAEKYQEFLTGSASQGRASAVELSTALEYVASKWPSDQTISAVETGPRDDGGDRAPNIKVLPGGRVSRNDAAAFLGRKPKTLAMWAFECRGPSITRVGGRCFYQFEDLKRFAAGGQVVDRAA